MKHKPMILLQRQDGDHIIMFLISKSKYLEY